MGWTSKYWDAIEQLYWTPKYLGLKSISRRHWDIRDDHVTIPLALTNPSGPLYRRATTARDFAKTVRRHEETFNHIFELAFGILDGEITNEIFGGLTAHIAPDSLVSYGRELGPALGEPKLYSLSQPDGFFVGDTWTLAVELKFDAVTSVDQLAKYLLALALARQKFKSTGPAYLLYISPHPDDLLSSAFPFEARSVDANCWDIILNHAKPAVSAALKDIEATAKSVLDDLHIHTVGWSQFLLAIEDNVSRRDAASAEARTVNQVLTGLASEIKNHPDSRIL